MKTIAILHYHLRPGGVTTVIRNAERALDERYRLMILADFDYDQRPARSRRAFWRDAGALRDRLARRLHGVDLLHTHNVGLGKNPRLTAAVKLLAESGTVRILNQVHDFPEENRPDQMAALVSCTGRHDAAFARSLCYYDHPRVHWATLTTTDAAKLAKRGVPRAKITVLPNPIDDPFFTQRPPRASELAQVRQQLADYARAQNYRFDPDQPFLLSPMKVMRRKNNREAVELIRRFGGRFQLVVSLDAASEADRAYSDRLKRLIQRQQLPVVIGFGYELENPLPLFHLARAILTTSRAEGFGYTFVEGWLCRKLVIGRDLPGVTRDFRRAGMKLDHLYRRLDDQTVGRLKRLLARPPRALIEHNRRIVLKEYSLKAYRKRFDQVVDSILR